MKCFLSRWVQAFNAPVFVHLMTTGLLTLKHGSSKQMNHSTLSLSIRRTPHWLWKDVVFLRSLNTAPLMIVGKMLVLMKFLIWTATMSPHLASSTSSCASSSSISAGTGSAVQRLVASRSHLQPPAAANWLRLRPDFDQQAAAGGCAPSATGYARGRYIKTTPCFAKWLRKLMVKIGSRIYMLMVAEEEPRSEHANSELVSTNEQQDERTHT